MPKRYKRYSFRLPTGHRIFLNLDPRNPHHQPVIRTLEEFSDPRLRTLYVWNLIVRDIQMCLDPKQQQHSVLWQQGWRWDRQAETWTRVEDREEPSAWLPGRPKPAAQPPAARPPIPADTRDFFERLGIADLLPSDLQQKGEQDDTP